VRPLNATGLIESPGFQPPRFIDSLEDCSFYHAMDLPGYGFIPGDWDLRADVDNYLGNQDLRSKSVIDVGTGSGYLCFEMEKRGAEVTAFDRFFKHGDETMEQIPYADFDRRFGMTLDQRVQERRYMLTRMQNSFWLSHRAHQSKAKLYNGSIYQYPAELGRFDYAFFGSVLLHLRNPVQALLSFAPAIRDKIIVTDVYENIGGAGESPVMFLRANATDKNQDTWWYLTPAFLENLLGVLGFPKFSVKSHQARFAQSQTDVKLYTVVAER
jgi:SAM-dependent methyltransferase